MQPIFLVSVPRSGSTMLRLILDSHPCVFSTVELPWIGGNYIVDGDGPEVSVRCLYRRLLHSAVDTSWNDIEGLRSACRSFVEQVAQGAMGARGKTVWVEKTPDNIIQVPFLAELFPDAKFLRLIRDGRDVALSTVDVADWTFLNYFVQWSPEQVKWINIRLGVHRRLCSRLPVALQEIFLKPPRHAEDLKARTILYPVANTFHNALYRWRAWNQLYERYARELAIRQLTVRYEDLLLDPQKTLPAILDFIGVGWDKRVLDYGKYDHDLRRGDIGGTSAMRFDRISPENAYKWSTRLTPRQRGLVRARFDDYLVSTGYEATPS